MNHTMANGSESSSSMLPTSVDFIHKKCVFGEMKSVCGSVEFLGKLARLHKVTQFFFCQIFHLLEKLL